MVERKTDGQDHSADHAAQLALHHVQFGGRRSGKTLAMEEFTTRHLQTGEPLYVHGGGKLSILRMDDPCDEWGIT